MGGQGHIVFLPVSQDEGTRVVERVGHWMGIRCQEGEEWEEWEVMSGGCRTRDRVQ